MILSRSIRAAIVQNQHLAVLAEKLGLDQFMLYAHGSDLCHDFELRHAMANCFEALMGAIFLDSGIEVSLPFCLPINCSPLSVKVLANSCIRKFYSVFICMDESEILVNSCIRKLHSSGFKSEDNS